jgi:AAA domain
VHYIASIPNPGTEGIPKFLHSDDDRLIARWIKAEDRPGFSIYEGPNPLKPAAARHGKDSLSAIVELFADIDFKDLIETPEQADEKLAHLLLVPTKLVDSGHGRHIRYELKEPISFDDPAFERACAIQEKLIEYFAADPQVRPWSLLRRPGTTNSKHEPHVLCRVLQRGSPVDLTELEEMCDLIEGAPLLTRRPRATNGHDHTEGAPRTAEGGRLPVDVDQRLANMRWQGPGGSSIHATQLSVSAAMLRHGISLEETVGVVLAATRDAVASEDTTAWDWTQEEHSIRRMGVDLVNKDPGELADRLPDALRQKVASALAEGRRPKVTYASHIGWHVRSWETGAGDPGAAQSKTDLIRNLLLKGTTIGEVLKATGWQTVSLPHHARASGLKLTKHSENGVTKYKGTPSGEAPAPNEARKARPAAPRFKLMRYCDLRPGMGDQDYLVDELLPTEGLVVVWGKFKCLKTFWVYDLMLHIAKGWEYRDRAVRQGMVIYCAFEGAHGFGKRTEAQRRHYDLADDDNVPLHVMPCQMNLVTDHKKFVADIGGQLLENEKPAVVVLDTLNRSLVGSESKDADMSACVAAASAIREAFKCLVVIVHHCGWDETRPRGHSSLSAAIEGQLAVTRQETHITVQIEFLRDGPEGSEIHSAIKIVEVGEDANGKPLTSLVVLPSNEAPSGGGFWPKALIVFRRAMKTALANSGEDFQENALEPPVRAVATEEVRKEFYETYPAKGNTPEQCHATKRKQFGRCLERAQIEGLIQIREPDGQPQLVWFTGRHTTWDRE